MNFLPGWFPGMSGGGNVTSLEFLNSTTSSNSDTITGHASIQAGDLLVMVDAVWRGFSSPPSSAVPSGFTQIITSTTGGSSATRMTLSFKIADGSEASSLLTGMSGSGGAAKVLLVFRGDIDISSASSHDPDEEATSGNPSAQTITSGSGVPPLVVIAAYTSSGSVNPRTFTVSGSPAKDDEVQATGSSIDVWLAWKIYDTSPADVTADMDDEGSDNILETCFLQVA